MNVKEVIKKLTLDEKISLLEGKNNWETMNIDRVGIPSIMMTDGPHGIRKEIPTSEGLVQKTSELACSFPTESTISCSFDPKLGYQMGHAIGQEARNKNVQVVLGPGVNIKRNPLCGRNFEYYSEDPLLTGKMACEFVRGIEDNNVGACVKHFACNNQEKYRMTINAVVDERALKEIYLKSFEMVVKNSVSAVMCSYNKLNGEYTSENIQLLRNILKDEWGFKGTLITDWGAVNNRVKGLIAGQDLEMPTSNGYHGKKLKEAYLKGEINTDLIDESVERILNMVNKYHNNQILECDYDAHHALCRDIASQSSVLLKCDNNILPLKEYDRVLFVGALAKNPRYQGGGSSFMNPYKLDNIYDNISSYTNNYLYCDGYSMEKDGYDLQLVNEACDLSKKVNKVVIFAGLFSHYEAEGFDRTDLDLPLGQLKLIEEIYKVNKNIIVVVQSGSVVNLDFNNRVKGLLYSGLGGEASALAILDNLYGKVVPSGRLSETFMSSSEDYITTKNFNQTNSSTYYSESIFVGYRYFTSFNKKVIYPFGYGLSYTSFEYSNLNINTSTITKSKKIKVSVDVKNVGNYSAKEVVLLFVQNNDNSSVYKAKRELRAFDKVELAPGQTTTVTFELDYNDFSYYDVYMKKYNVDSGYYKIQICKDCETVVLEETIERKDNDPDFVKHPQTAYNRKDRLVIKDEDFQEIYGQNLPPKQIKHPKVITMENTLDDVKHKLMGKIIIRIVKKMASEALKNETSDWGKKNFEETLMTNPFKTFAVFNGNMVSPETIEGMVEMLNGHIFKGLKKMKRG